MGATSPANERRNLRAELDAIADALSPDEVRTLVYIASKLLEGRAVYGPFDALKDPRDFVKERAEEAADLIVYHAFSEVQRALKAGKE